jgi:hypothetical protein
MQNKFRFCLGLQGGEMGTQLVKVNGIECAEESLSNQQPQNRLKGLDGLAPPPWSKRYAEEWRRVKKILNKFNKDLVVRKLHRGFGFEIVFRQPG